MLNQVMKFDIKQFKDNALTLEPEKLYSFCTLMEESELLRIVKHLNPDNKNPMSDKSSYPYIKDIIVVNVGKEEELYKGSKGFLTVNNIVFKRLIASSGNIRNQKSVFVKEELYDKVNEILLCGLPVDLQFDVFAKFSAYYALAATDSKVIKNIPRIVVVDDYTNNIKENFDLVIEKKKDQYEVKNNQERNIPILPFDGGGLLSLECAKNFCNELGIPLSDNEEDNKKIIPACWQFRFIPCGKGNLFTFDLKNFAVDKCVTQITDIWKKKWDLFDDEGNLLIDVILTKSQFKFNKSYMYSSYEAWLSAFTTELYGYKRTFNISGYSDANRINDRVVLSYQPLQTLSLMIRGKIRTVEETQKDIQTLVERLCKKTVNKYRKIKTDVNEFLKFRGMVEVDEETGNPIPKEDQYLPPYYKALLENKDLFYDDYIQNKIKDDIKGFKNRSCKGMLLLNGSFQTFVPDLVALAQHAFGLEVTGVLGTDEVYNQFWHSKNVKKIALCRFPHIAKEWKLSNVVKPVCEDIKYLDYINEGYVTNIWDSTALRMGTADFDGDHIYGMTEKTLLDILEKQKGNTILHIPPETTEKEKQTPKPTYPINDIEKLIETDCNGMKGGIGQCINDITTIWSLPQSEERNRYIKIMSVIGAQIIDYAKTGIMPKIPNDIKKFLKKQKLPYFMRYKYPKKFTEEKRVNRTKSIKGLEKAEKFNRNECTVNLICWYLEEQFDQIDKEVEGKYNTNFSWDKLIKDKPNIYSNTYKEIKSQMEEFNKEHCKIAQSRIYETKPEDVRDNDYKFRIFYDYVRNSLLSLCRADVGIDKILDYLLNICYTDEKYTDKSILWNCFPDELVSRVTGIYYEEKEFDTDIYKKKAEKSKKKIEQIRKNNELVKVNLSIDQELKDDNGNKSTKKISVDVTNIDVDIFRSEVDYINRKSLTWEQKKVLLALLVMYKLHKQNDGRFFICQGKKNKITPTHICKLAGINQRKYDEILTILLEKECYLSPSGQTNLLVNITWDKDEGYTIENISDINQLKKKYKKILLTKAS